MIRLLAAFALGSMLAPLAAAPINFNTALPVGRSEFIQRTQVVVRQFDNDRSDADRDLEIAGLVTVLGYGLSPKLALFAALPYWDKSLRLTTTDGRFRRSTSGIGDLRVFARYTLHQTDQRSRTFRLANFVGVKAPTGDHDRVDRLGRLPPALQSGTGSWDGFVGVVATHQTLSDQIDMQVAYTANGTDHQFKLGDSLALDLSWQHRLWLGELGTDTPAFLYGVLEARATKQRRNRTIGVTDPNSGGNTVYISPGLQWVTRRWILEAGLQLPLVQKLNGTALATDRIVTAGYRLNF